MPVIQLSYEYTKVFCDHKQLKRDSVRVASLACGGIGVSTRFNFSGLGVKFESIGSVVICSSGRYVTN